MPQEPAGGVQGAIRLVARFQRFFWDIAGLGLIALALMTMMAMLIPSWSGGILKWWVDTLMRWIGWGSVWLVSAMLVIGLWMLLHRASYREPVILWGRVIALELVAFSSIAILTVLNGSDLSAQKRVWMGVALVGD